MNYIEDKNKGIIFIDNGKREIQIPMSYGITNFRKLISELKLVRFEFEQWCEKKNLQATAYNSIQYGTLKDYALKLQGLIGELEYKRLLMENKNRINEDVIQLFSDYNKFKKVIRRTIPEKFQTKFEENDNGFLCYVYNEFESIVIKITATKLYTKNDFTWTVACEDYADEEKIKDNTERILKPFRTQYGTEFFNRIEAATYEAIVDYVGDLIDKLNSEIAKALA